MALDQRCVSGLGEVGEGLPGVPVGTQLVHQVVASDHQPRALTVEASDPLTEVPEVVQEGPVRGLRRHAVDGNGLRWHRSDRSAGHTTSGQALREFGTTTLGGCGRDRTRLP